MHKVLEDMDLNLVFDQYMEEISNMKNHAIKRKLKEFSDKKKYSKNILIQ